MGNPPKSVIVNHQSICSFIENRSLNFKIKLFMFRIMININDLLILMHLQFRIFIGTYLATMKGNKLNEIIRGTIPS